MEVPVQQQAAPAEAAIEEVDDEKVEQPKPKAAKTGKELFSQFYSLSNPEKYASEMKAYGLFANKRINGAPPGGWCVIDADGKVASHRLPKFNNDTLVEFASWLLEDTNKYKKGSLDMTRSALNHYYIAAGFRAPWQGSSYFRAMSAYCAARKQQAIENGEVNAAGLRCPVPEDVLEWMMKQAEGMASGSETKTAFTLILIGWLFCLRASSTSFVRGDIRFARDDEGNPTYLIIDSTSLKMEMGSTPGEYKQRRCPAPDANLGVSHPRARLFELIEDMLLHGDLSISGEPKEASGVVTGWLKDLVPENISNLPKGHSISSHSVRKAAASSLQQLGCPIETTIMPWGRWMSMSSCQLYLHKGYQVSRFAGAMFDWMLPMGSKSSYGHCIDV